MPHLIDLAIPFESKNFDICNLTISSASLSKNSLGDNNKKHNYILKVKKNGEYPVVYHLSGYFSNGAQSFNQKTLEDNLPQMIDKETTAKNIPLAHHVFVDAMTSVGGSQFINSKGCGNYGDYLQHDVVMAVDKTLSTKKQKQFRCVLGASSGGYGALEHVSREKSPFGVAVAIAPDCLFEVSLLPDFYKASESLKEIPDIKTLRKKLEDVKFRESKNFFHTINCIAMTLCYSDASSRQFNYPLDLHSGQVREAEFTNWKQKDPVVFLRNRIENIKHTHIYLEVGKYDEFNLQFGARQINEILKSNKLKHHYFEYIGGHFKTTPRKMEALKWLMTIWS